LDAPRLVDDNLSRHRLRLWLQMLKAVRHVENDIRERLRRSHDMTLPRFDVLAALHAAPEGLKMTDLSKQLMVSNGNVTGIVDRLVADGLVERTLVPSDRRAFLIKITGPGRVLMDQMIADHRRWIHELFENVNETDAARAVSIMLDIRHKDAR
jgi:DNA-binding MarR family transcriptional regulator